MKPRPAHVPKQTMSIIGHNRRATTVSAGPASICHALVTSDGTARIAAAWTGGIATASRPIEMVGSPSPITPLTSPASANTAAMKRRLGSAMASTLTHHAATRNVEISKLGYVQNEDSGSGMRFDL